MKNIFAVAFLLVTSMGAVQAQFYYRDILSNKDLLTEMALYRQNKIHTIKVKSFEEDGSESDGFFCEKRISRDYQKVEFFTNSNVSGTSLFTSYFNDKGKLTQTIDSSSIAVSINTYSYDAEGRIKSILSSIKSSDDDFLNEIREEHIYVYNDKGIPEKMIRVKNKADSTTILFGADENNNISIEKDTKNAGKYYYYYDAKSRLTDIVHYNEYKEKLLPDYLFEYNTAGQLTQMTSTEEGGSDYYIWRYTYDNGLRNREKCFSKERKLMGSIEYEYK